MNETTFCQAIIGGDVPGASCALDTAVNQYLSQCPPAGYTQMIVSSVERWSAPGYLLATVRSAWQREPLCD